MEEQDQVVPSFKKRIIVYAEEVGTQYEHQLVVDSFHDVPHGEFAAIYEFKEFGVVTKHTNARFKKI